MMRSCTFFPTFVPLFWVVFVSLSGTARCVHRGRTSLAFEDVVDLPQQQRHVAQLRLPRLAEDVQVLLGDLAGWVEGEGLDRRDDLRGNASGYV